jgi:hypothetical protein
MKHLFKLSALACFLILAAVFFSSDLAKPAAPVPAPMLYPIQDEEGFQAVAKSFHKIPFSDPQLEFSILLPKDWASEETVQSESSANLNRAIVSEIARFTSPVINTMRASVVIESIKLSREISAENWLKGYIMTRGYAIQDKVTAINEKKALAHCAGTDTEGKKNDYIHILAMINGNNAVVIRFEIPVYLKESLEFLAKRSLESYQFILETDRAIESQKIFNFADVLKFSYPESWNVNNMDVRDSRSMSMQLYNKGLGGRLDGMIRFLVIKRGADTTLKKETDELKKYFSDFLGVTFTKLVSSDKAPVKSRFLFSRFEVYQVTQKKANTSGQELRLAVVGDKNWYVFGFLMTPSEADSFPTWANNIQSFEMVVRSLR